MTMKNIKYTERNRHQLFEDLLSRHYSRTGKPEEIAAFRRFFEDGDIDKFIEFGGSQVDPNSIFFVGANPTLENLKYRLQVFWDDLLMNPDKYRDSVHIPKEFSKEKLFQTWAESCVTSFESIFLPAKMYSEVVMWVYGESYKSEVSFSMSFGNQQWKPTIKCDANWLATSLLSIASYYFFDVYDDYLEDPIKVVPLLGFICSALPSTSEEIYGKKLFELRHRNLDGEYSGFSAKQSVIRTFIALANGVLSEDQTEDGMDKIIVRNPEDLSGFIQNFESSLPYPDLYDELVKFVIASGEEYLWASED